MLNFYIVQALGIITLLLFAFSLQQRKKETFLLLQIFGTLMYVIQYILTDRITGAVIFSIVVVRGLVFFYYKKKDKKPSAIILIIFLSALAVCTFFTWQDYLSIIPFIATSAKTWGTWQDDMRWMRRTSLLAQSTTIVYNFAAGMYTGAITEVCTAASTIIAMWRYDYNTNSN